MDAACVFCDIVNGSAPAKIVQRWPEAIAIVPLAPVVAGHLLVISTAHVRDALEDPDVSAAALRRAAEIAPHPCNLITNVGREATQSVWHLHWHIVPRAVDDGLALPWYSGKGGRKARASA
jgi:histidine triad (HIT) family protein